jgi:hypothetical protein
LSEQHPFADPAAFADATELLGSFGQYARLEAAARAAKSRDAGNVLHFCRWRQAERTIALLSSEELVGTIH